ncbi:MAG TPA: hypothetical protein VGA85_05720 [Dehalococcoidales bacterium]
MKSKIKKFLTVWLSILMVFTLLLPGCGCSPSPNIRATLEFSELPILGKEVELTATFTLNGTVYQKASDVKAEIVLPEGIEKVDGDLQFQGDFLLGQTYEIKVIVKTVKIGLWSVEAKAFWFPGVDCLGGTKELWVNVTENDATVSNRPPKPSGIPTLHQTEPPSDSLEQ